MNWYVGMNESDWFFWGFSVPYIKRRDGRKEFVKYQSKILFILGLIHIVLGVVLIPFPDSGFGMFVLWLFMMFGVIMALRSHFIDVASGINRKYLHARKRPTKVCPKCGREMWADLKICTGCGELLFEQGLRAQESPVG